MNEPAPTTLLAAVPAAVTLTGRGLVLREWADADVPAMAELFDDPDVDRFTPLRAPFDHAAAAAYLATARRTRAEGHRLQLAITTDGRAPLGEILLFAARGRTGEAVPGGAELAYAVGRRHRGQHLAARAAALITDYAFETLGAGSVRLHIAAANPASAAVARAAGFHPTDAPPVMLAGARDPLLTWLRERPEGPSAGLLRRLGRGLRRRR